MMAISIQLVEIIIVGFCFFLSIVPPLAWLFQIDPREILTFYVNVPIQFQLLISYMAGVVWNRFCDQIFHLVDVDIICARFTDRAAYQLARIRVILAGDAISLHVNAYRNLIRVARSTAVLVFSYLLFTPVYLAFIPPISLLPAINKIILFCLQVVALILSIFAWYRLQKGYVAAIYDAEHVLSTRT